MNALDVNMSLAELFARVFLGIILIFQGYDKLFIVKIKNVVSMFNNESAKIKASRESIKPGLQG